MNPFHERFPAGCEVASFLPHRDSIFRLLILKVFSLKEKKKEWKTHYELTAYLLTLCVARNGCVGGIEKVKSVNLFDFSYLHLSLV